MILFTAIELSETAKGALCDVMENMRSIGVTGNYTRRENLHLTLAYIGESEDAESIIHVMNNICVQPFSLNLRGVGSFGDILWAGVEQSDVLINMAEELKRELRAVGFEIERRPFKPHITLVRKASGFCLDDILVPQVEMTVRKMTLFHSHRVDGVLMYTPLFVREF